MIDHLARKKMAELSRQLANGQITNFQFEDAILRSKEVGLNSVFYNGLWPLYDDLREHKLRDNNSLTKEGREWVARIILFLRSGNPYRYPHFSGILFLPLNIIVVILSISTFGWFARKWHSFLWRNGNESVWPFFSLEEYQQALQNPIYLSGLSKDS